jgi:LuxR family maltose regulon positive regulatory protein
MQASAPAPEPPVESSPDPRSRHDLPTLPEQYVPRPRLVEQLDRDTSCPLTLVSAPAGSGKSSLIAEWRAARGAGEWVGWVTFEAGEETFWPPLVGALERLGIAVPRRKFPDTATPVDRRLLASLASALASQPTPLTVVLDGYELVSPDVAHDLDFLLTHNGHRLRLVMGTRIDPVLPLYRYRLAGTMTEVRMADLGFTDREVTSLLAKVGITLSESSVHALNLRTHGWAVGLQFAARFLAECEDQDRAVEEIVGDIGNIAEYLVGEVLAVQTPEVRDLLLSTSVPDSLRPGLDVALGGPAAPRTLESLTHLNAFIEPISGHAGSYRYHPLFRDLLRAELAYESPELSKELQRKAAEWFAREGMLVAAASHFAAIEAWSEIAELVVDTLTVADLLADTAPSALVRTLRLLPDDSQDPAVAVVRAGLALMDGDLPRFRAQLSGITEPPKRDGSAHERAQALSVAVLQVVGASHGAEPIKTMALAEHAEVALDDLDATQRASKPQLAAMVQTRKGVAAALGGAFTQADESLRVGFETAQDVGLDSLAVECLSYQAALASFDGRLSRSAALANRALGLADTDGFPDVGGTWTAHAALAWVDIERYELGAASRHVELAQRVAPGPGEDIPRILLAMARARLHAARGDLAAALGGMDLATAETQADSWLAQVLCIETGHLRVRQGEPAVALLEVEEVAGLEPAEVHLVIAEARLAQGDDRAANDSLSRVLVKEAPTMTQVSGWLTETGRQLELGSRPRARAALDRALRLAAREMVRRPFREAPHGVRRLLAMDDQLMSEHGWLSSGEAGASDRQLRRVAGLRRLPERVEVEVPVVESLTPREVEVLVHLSELLSTDEIATAMFLSVNTIRTHVRSILRKLGVSRRNAAVRRARELEILPS